MRGLFGNVVAASFVWIVPIASESLAEDRVQGLLDTAEPTISPKCSKRKENGAYGGLMCQPLR
jgi:hypothetical protein